MMFLYKGVVNDNAIRYISISQYEFFKRLFVFNDDEFVVDNKICDHIYMINDCYYQIIHIFPIYDFATNTGLVKIIANNFEKVIENEGLYQYICAIVARQGMYTIDTINTDNIDDDNFYQLKPNIGTITLFGSPLLAYNYLLHTYPSLLEEYELFIDSYEYEINFLTQNGASKVNIYLQGFSQLGEEAQMILDKFNAYQTLKDLEE